MIVRHSAETQGSYIPSSRNYDYGTCSWSTWTYYPEAYYDKTIEWALGTDTPRFKFLEKTGRILPFTQYIKYSASGDACLWDLQLSDISKTSCGGQKVMSESRNIRMHPFSIRNVEILAVPQDVLDDGQRMLRAAAAKIYSQGMDALTFLAELKQLARMLTGILTRWADLLRRHRFEDLWLEGRYGWRPLIYDVMDLVKALTSLDFERTRFKERQGLSYTLVESPIVTWSSLGETIQASSTITKEISIRGSVVMDITVPRFRFNPFVTAWEIIPLSFVIDWFIDISTTLLAMSGRFLATEYTGAYGVKTTATGTLDAVVQTTTNTNNRYVFTPVSTQQCKYTRYQRVPAQIEVGFPPLSVDLDFGKLIDLISLIVQRARK